MQIRQCKECGKLFQSYDKALCVECQNELDEVFIKVRDYIYRHPSATIAQVCESTGAKERQIKELLKQDRLNMATDEPLFFCESCKAPIHGGKLCERCAQSFKKAFEEMDHNKKRPMANESQKTGETAKSYRMHVVERQSKNNK